MGDSQDAPRSPRPRPEVGDFVVLPLTKMEPCPTQGPTRMERVDWLIKHWNEEKLFPLRVYRRDGVWYIRNGRHRWLAAKALGLTELPCEVAGEPARPWRYATLRFWENGEDPHDRSGYGSHDALHGIDSGRKRD